jgi:hypothetical protein
MTYRIAYRLPVLNVVTRDAHLPYWMGAAGALGARTDGPFLRPSLSRSGGRL